MFSAEAPAPDGRWMLLNLETAVDRCLHHYNLHEISIHRLGELSPSGENAMHPTAPRSGRHAALLLLAGASPQR
ncbi:MAG: hypothetical protein AB1434_09625, partial [Pseudomonadota bacterium]